MNQILHLYFHFLLIHSDKFHRRCSQRIYPYMQSWNFWSKEINLWGFESYAHTLIYRKIQFLWVFGSVVHTRKISMTLLYLYKRGHRNLYTFVFIYIHVFVCLRILYFLGWVGAFLYSIILYSLGLVSVQFYSLCSFRVFCAKSCGRGREQGGTSKVRVSL